MHACFPDARPTLTVRGPSTSTGASPSESSYPCPSHSTILTVLSDSVEELARKGIDIAQVAIAWSLSKPGVTAPIVGTTCLDNLKDIIDTPEFCTFP
ncbi:hypothetical protein BKA93DRAFT_762860 [Sparassis latifolia]